MGSGATQIGDYFHSEKLAVEARKAAWYCGSDHNLYVIFFPWGSEYLRFEGGTGVGAIVGSSHTEPEEVRLEV